MIIVNPSVEIIDEIDGQAILRKLEMCARTCYQSFDKAGEGTAEKLVGSCIARGHESVLEHVSVSVRFVTDRAIHNEIVRHRLTAVSCESTRYCKYKDGITVIEPGCFDESEIDEGFMAWEDAMIKAEEGYMKMIDDGYSPQMARAVLPLSTKCEYIVTANLREWRHIFDVRCSHASHPEMRRVMILLMKEFHAKIPVVFNDIYDKHIDADGE